MAGTVQHGVTGMQLLALTALVMVAFAANSILNRLALVDGAIGAMDFALWRVGSGAVALAALVWFRQGRFALIGPQRALGVSALTVYLLGFSAAYLALDAGAGALILFGGVQITMFAGALWRGEPVPQRRWLGAGLALIGLAWLFWPGSGARIGIGPGLLMAAAAIGWGLYSLAGRDEADPLSATAANFCLALPLCAAAAIAWPSATAASSWGIGLAILSGVVTSAMGYALWYSVLPRLGASLAAVAQLTVPVIALAAGAVFLGEVVTLCVALAAGLVLGGVALSALPNRPKKTTRARL